MRNLKSVAATVIQEASHPEEGEASNEENASSGASNEVDSDHEEESDDEDISEASLQKENSINPTEVNEEASDEEDDSSKEDITDEDISEDVGVDVAATVIQEASQLEEDQDDVEESVSLLEEEQTSDDDEEDVKPTAEQRRLLVDYSDEPDEELFVHIKGSHIDPKDDRKLNRVVANTETRLRTSLFIRPASPALDVFKFRETQYPPGIVLKLFIMNQI